MLKPIKHDVKQGTPEWFALRLGRMTASCGTAIAANSKGLESLCIELAAERLTGIGDIPFAPNADMLRGQELEAAARTMYSFESEDIEQVGFLSYGDYAGCSPDGLVGLKGGIEIKCPNDVNYLTVCLDKKIKSDYLWQIYMNLLISGREWWDYVCYNPHFKNPLYVQRVLPDDKKFEALLAGLESGEKQIKEILKKMEIK